MGHCGVPRGVPGSLWGTRGVTGVALGSLWGVCGSEGEGGWVLWACPPVGVSHWCPTTGGRILWASPHMGVSTPWACPRGILGACPMGVSREWVPTP